MARNDLTSAAKLILGTPREEKTKSFWHRIANMGEALRKVSIIFNLFDKSEVLLTLYQEAGGYVKIGETDIKDDDLSHFTI